MKKKRKKKKAKSKKKKKPVSHRPSPAHVRVVRVERQRVPDEVDRGGREPELRVQGAHGHPPQVAARVRPRVPLSVILHENKERPRPPLLEQAEQGRPQRLHVRGGDPLDPVPRKHEGAVDGLELEVASDLGPHEDADELAPAHDELGDGVDVVVPGGAQVRGW